MSTIARRRFLASVGAGLAAGLAFARSRGLPYRVGLLPDHVDAYLAWFREAMLRRGWQDGREYVLQQPGMLFGENPEEAARRVANGRPDIIFTVGTQYSLAAQRRVPGIPTVVWAFGYPVESGLAESLARPGKNVTGVALYAGTSMFGKLLELLRELQPGAKRIGVLMCYVPPHHPQVETDLILRDLAQAASRLDLAVGFANLPDPGRVDTALSELSAFAPDGVLLTTGVGVWPVREKVLRAALAKRWPTVSDSHWAPGDPLQPLASYGPSVQGLIDQAVAYLVRILGEGAKPADLPILQPAKLELVVNSGTAKALGLAVPEPVLLRADRVIA